MSALIFFVLSITIFIASSLDYLDLEKQRRLDEPELSLTFFSELRNIYLGGRPVENAKYPYIAKVVHSTENPYPFIGTAVCIAVRTFIAPTRSTSNIKLKYTRLLYLNLKLRPLVFVFPSETTRQAFEDITIIVTARDEFNGPWSIIKPLDVPRTDKKYNWFSDLQPQKKEFIVVGFAIPESMRLTREVDTEFDLMEVTGKADMTICPSILTRGLFEGFRVPCFHTCTVPEFNKTDPKCKNYLGAEGAAVIEKQSNTLYGITTWGATILRQFSLPVGFAIPNTPIYKKNLECAVKIRQTVLTSHFQELCDMD